MEKKQNKTTKHIELKYVYVCFGGQYWRVVVKKALTMWGKYFEVSDYGGYLVLKEVSYWLKGGVDFLQEKGSTQLSRGQDMGTPCCDP